MQRSPRQVLTDNGGVVYASQVCICAGLHLVPQREPDAPDGAVGVDGALGDGIHQLVVVGGILDNCVLGGVCMRTDKTLCLCLRGVGVQH